MSSDEIRKRAADNPLYEQGRVLPILPPKQQPITEPDWRRVPAPKLFQVRPPKGAPNVLVIFRTKPLTPTHRRLAARSISRPWTSWRRKD